MRSYSHLSEDERDQIGVLRAAGRSMGAIARALGRAKATISRELQRNALPLGGYSTVAAFREPSHHRIFDLAEFLERQPGESSKNSIVVWKACSWALPPCSAPQQDRGALLRPRRGAVLLEPLPAEGHAGALPPPAFARAL